MARLLHQADQRARELLQAHREKLNRLAQALLEREVLHSQELEELIGPPNSEAPRPQAPSPVARDENRP